MAEYLEAVPNVITRELIAERITELQKQRAEALATANACAGALQDCEYWLTILSSASLVPRKDDTPAS